jgi:hypothetical protein
MSWQIVATVLHAMLQDKDASGMQKICWPSVGPLLSDETVRRWVNHFGPKIAAYLRKRRPKLFADAARSRILSGICACETDLSG